MTDEIIDCGGRYEVHPKVSGGWAVVNSDSGDVRSSFADKGEAVALAKRLNAEIQADEDAYNADDYARDYPNG